MKCIVVKRKYNLQSPNFINEVCRGVLPQAVFKITIAGEVVVSPQTLGEYEPDGIYLLQLGSRYVVLFPESAGNRQQAAALVKELQKPELGYCL